MNLERQAGPGNNQEACHAVAMGARDDSGVTALEYALLASLIAVVAAGSIVLLGGGVDSLWQRISDLVGAVV